MSDHRDCETWIHGRPKDEESDLKFIARARDAIEAGDSVYYTSWW